MFSFQSTDAPIKPSDKEMAPEKDEDVFFETEDVTVPFSLAQDAWKTYKEFRPAYPQSMLDLWFDYHRNHGGRFAAVHDVGAGKPLQMTNDTHLRISC